MSEEKIKALESLMINNHVADMAIIARSHMQLFWNFLFIIDYKSVNGNARYEKNPATGSTSYKRAERFLLWPAWDFYRGGNRKEFIVKGVETIKIKFSYANEDKIPRHWYQEEKVERIKDVAMAVGAKEQYESDYGFLSGIEHCDSSSDILRNFKEDDRRQFARFLYVKSIAYQSRILEAVAEILKVRADPEIVKAVNRVGSLYVQENNSVKKFQEK